MSKVNYKNHVRLHIDFETHSVVDLKAAGVDRYAKDPTTGLWCVAYKFIEYDPDDHDLIVKVHETKTWRTLYAYDTRDRFPDEVLDHVKLGGAVVAHNAAFEYAIWNHVVPRYLAANQKKKFKQMIPGQMNCTMARAMALGYPPSLEQCANFLKLPIQKDEGGRRIMMQLARPRKIADDGTPVWWDFDGCSQKEIESVKEKHDRLLSYCVTDVDVEIGIDHEIDDLSTKEQYLWRADRVINDRGVKVDTASVQNALDLLDIYTKQRLHELELLTDHAVRTITDLTGLRLWMKEQGVPTKSLDKASVIELLARKNLPDNVRTALEIRQDLGRASLAKLRAMLACVDHDDRARGLFQFHGATTGRWSGRRIQTQNMVRPFITQENIERLFVILSEDRMIPGERLEQFLGSGYANHAKTEKPLTPTEAIASMMRGMLIADEGCTLIGCDLNQIEARVLPWLAGDEKKLDLFRSGEDIYKHTAADIFQTPIAEVNEQQRFIGKVGELALGYGGGRGAFVGMAKNYGVTISEDYAEEIKQKWRRTNRKITRFWYDMEKACRAAIENPGKVYKVGFIRFVMDGEDLKMVLPSGRKLTYPRARIAYGSEIQFYGQNTYTRQWGWQKTYGGMLTENATQAVARDVESDAILRLEMARMPIVMHTHDEIVVEVEKAGSNEADVEKVVEIMTQNSKWNIGLPIEAEAWCGVRYRK